MSTLVLEPKSDTLADVVAGNIKAECGRRDVSGTALARYLGMTRSTLNDRWHGRMQWRLNEIEQVAELFGISVIDLLRPRQDSNLQPKD